MSSSSTSPQLEHDVFVSFRGEDVRDAFISYLIIWLKEVGLSYFCDEAPEIAGNMIEKNIFPAIHHARVALIVLSKNYAESKWCLNELVEILKCHSERKNLVVIPIFYNVDPADVKNLTSQSEFGRVFELNTQGENCHQIEIWKGALQEVKKFLGFERKNFRKEPDLVDTIVQSICEQICPSQSINFAKTAIGAERLVDDVIRLLNISKKDVRVIGISGMIGIGKTTVAGAVCKATLKDFKRLIFLHKVGEAEGPDFVGLQKKLLQNLLTMNEQMPQDSFHGYTERIKSNLHRKKILLVLDGVTRKEQIKNLGIEKQGSFHHGSRILITTRDSDLLKDLDLHVDDTYNIEGLYRDEAFRLFCSFAFKREEPEEGYEVLSRYLAHYPGGHPTALEKWGSFLNKKKSRDEWQKFSEELEKNPDHINSFIPDFKRIFPEYLRKVVGLCRGDRRKKTWKNEGNTIPFLGWLDKGNNVRKIEGGVDSEGIKFITVHYDKNRRSPITIGRRGGETSTPPIELDCPGEYLIYMSGHTKEDSRRTILQSLTFHTNRGKCNSIGTDEEGRKFSFPYTGHEIVGFRWSCNGSQLESIEALYKRIAYARIAHAPIVYSGGVYGPFGGAGEKSWDSGDINGIFVRHADRIREIDFKSRTKSSKPRTTNGENGEEDTFEVELETPYECITSFSGYFKNACDGRILIKSLTFRTNKRILGPIGREDGKHFSSPSTSDAVKVTRFFGRTVDYYLESIGAQVESDYPYRSVGLFGCSNVSNSDDWDDRDDDYTNVRKIIVEFALDDVKSVGSVQKSKEKTFIRSITFHYEVKNRRPLQPRKHPDTPAEGVETLQINIHADEYLTSMSGYYMDNGITSLTFGTNERTLELTGRKKGIHFSSPVTGGRIVGFYGRSGKNLEAIGAYFEWIPHLYPIKSIGPFGGSGGETWDHGKFKGVMEIKVEHNINIHEIKFVYDGDSSGQSHPSHRIKNDGPGDYPRTVLVTLDYPREYLTSISGYVGENDAIQSLTFHSNKGSHGPYGEFDKFNGKYFWYSSNGTRITGFYGTRDPASGTLKSIGVHVEPVPRMYPFKTVGTPIEGSGGTPWDDGVHTDVRGFRISFGKAIKAIGIAYDNNGSFVSGSEHGRGYNNHGSFVLGLEPGKKRETDKYNEVILDYPKERLSSIRVWVDERGIPGQSIIHDLEIFTSKTTYGPFIPDLWQKRDKLTLFLFPSQVNGGRIIGFFGRVGRYLHSIGMRLEPYSD